MTEIVRILFLPANLFMGHPERAGLVAIGFGVLWAICFLRKGIKSGTNLPLLFAAILWVAYALEESFAMQRGWDIRVDLFLLWPPLFAVTVMAAWAGIRSIIACQSKPPDQIKRCQDAK